MVKSTNDRVIAMETRQAAAQLATPPHPQQAAASAPATTSPAPTPSSRPLASDTSGQRRPRSDEHQSDLAHFKTSLNTIRSVHESIQNPAELKNLVKEYRTLLNCLDAHQLRINQAAAAAAKKPKHQK